MIDELSEKSCSSAAVSEGHRRRMKYTERRVLRVKQKINGECVIR